MTLMIDPPAVPSRGRMWSHLASDTSFDELHAFARELGIPERGFDRDHYDVPSEWYDEVLARGRRAGHLARAGRPGWWRQGSGAASAASETAFPRRPAGGVGREEGLHP